MTVRSGILWLTILGAICVEGFAFAQNPSTPKAEPVPAASSDGTSPVKPSAGESVPSRAAKGEAELLLNTPLLQEALKILEERRQKGTPEPLQWSVAGIAIEGTADGDQALLQVTLQIQMLLDGKWIKVPLKLTEATLENQSYTGPGEAVAVTEIDPEQGYQWWLTGKGLHVLKFNLIVPLRKEPPGRRLQLTLPKTLVSKLSLRVPLPRLTAKGDEQGRATMALKPTPDGATMIEMTGLGPRLDLTWQPQPDLGAVETVLEARTAITATIDGRTLLLEANQRLLALQGAFKQVQVRLPRGCELLKVEGEFFKERVIDPKDPSQVLVTFKDDTPTTAPVDLKWTVRVEIPSQS